MTDVFRINDRRVFRINNRVPQHECSCHSASHSDETIDLPLTSHDVLVEQGRMTSEMRDRVRSEHSRANARMERAKREQSHDNAIPAPEYADMLPPSSLALIKGLR
jgi:hypothetical protein